MRSPPAAALAMALAFGCSEAPTTSPASVSANSSTAGPAYSISVTILGTLGGDGSGAYDINNDGDVVGGAETSSGDFHAFLWTKQDGMIDLGTLGGPSSFAEGINNRGHVVGSSETASGDSHAFLWTKQAGMIDLGTLGGSYSGAVAVNERGEVLGVSQNASGAFVPFLWTKDGGMIEIDDPVITLLNAQDINERGQVVGQGIGIGYIWTRHDGATDLATLGAPRVRPAAINDRGQVAGYDGRAIRWTPGKGLEDLGNLGFPGDITPTAINNRGDVAGFGLNTIEEVAFLWTETHGILELGTLGGSSSYAWGINDRGQVAGEADVGAVIWELVPRGQ